MAWTALLIPLVTLVAVFTIVGVAIWADSRRKEREAYYRHETYRKMLEGPGGSAAIVRELVREEESHREQWRVEGLKLGGLITAAAGVGLSVFLYFLDLGQPVYLVGVIPLLVGLVLAAYGFHMESRRRAGPG